MNGEREYMTIRKIDLLKVFFRSFLIQASWSFDRMQSLGFAFAIMPALKRLYPERDEFASRLRQHMEYFNTQPYLASFILGASIRMEEKRSSGRSTAGDVSALKNTLMAPLGALGDSFFWAALKPLSVLIAVFLLMTGAWWAPILFLVFYNLWHVWLRAAVLLWGYRSSGDVVSLIARYRFTRVARIFKALALVVLGGTIGLFPLWRPEFRPAVPAPGIITAGSAFLITLALAAVLKKGGTPIKLMLGLAAISVALAYAGVS